MNPDLLRGLTGADLVTHDLDRFGWWPNKGDAHLGDGSGEVGVLAEEPVTRVDGVGARRLDDVQNGLGIEVTLGGSLATKGEGLIGEADVKGVAIELGIDRNGPDSKLLASTDYSDSDLATVGDEDFLEERLIKHPIWLAEVRAKSEHSGPPNTRFVKIRHVRETGSTNQDLLAEAARGAEEGLVLMADHQSAGRGRQGRAWLDGGSPLSQAAEAIEPGTPDSLADSLADSPAESTMLVDDVPASSLLVSWLLRPRRQMQDKITIIPLLTGLAVADALDQLCGLQVGVKWPNDLLSVPSSGQMADERKLAGILVQGSTNGADTALVVGLGLNLAPKASRRLGDVATDLQTLLSSLTSAQGLPELMPTRFAVLNSVLIAVDKLYRRLEEEGSESILGLYRKRCVTLGRQVEMRTPGGIVRGLAIDVDTVGGLIVQTDTGPQTVTAGDARHIGSQPRGV